MQAVHKLNVVKTEFFKTMQADQAKRDTLIDYVVIVFSPLTQISHHIFSNYHENQL